jgi:hypothetical protein
MLLILLQINSFAAYVPSFVDSKSTLSNANQKRVSQRQSGTLK